MGDIYYPNVGLLLHGNGTNGSTTITDNSPSPKTVTANSGAQVSTAQSKYGGASILFDGTDDYLSIPTSSDFAFGTGDFTIEFWIYRIGTGQQYLYEGRNGSNTNTILLFLNSSAQLVFFANGSAAISTTSSPTSSTWAHVAVCRSGTSTKMFLDGTQIGSTFTDSINYVAPATTLFMGSTGTGLNQFNGYLDDIRITKGVARYTSNFTAPTAEFANFADLTGTAAITYTGAFSGVMNHGISGTAAISYPGGSFSGQMFAPVVGDMAASYSGSFSGEALFAPPMTGTAAITYSGTFSGSGYYARYMENLSEVADATDPPSVTAYLYNAIRETLLCAADAQVSAKHYLSIAEAEAAIDTLLGAKLFQDAITEVANGGVTSLVQLSLRMVERVAASDLAITSWKSAVTVAETATALDLLASGWAMNVIETADANDTITPFVTMLTSLLEEAVATDTPSNSLKITLTTTETASGDEDVSSMATFMESMDENAVGAVTLRLGDDVYTGWVLNTDENAVSEFQKYEFNSFCQLRGEYYAAGSDGIYRIGGTTDAGDAIVGYLKTGLLDFGSSMQKRMDSAWLAIATDGTVRMKVVTTEDGAPVETWYQVTSRDEGAVAENMRLKIGKGLKSRYWQFELVVEDANEFELEELQLIPMILSRRT